jgi:aryl-alcohol dehydrogenase-like predicted oxidoreductase
MYTRRAWLEITAGAGASLALSPRLLAAWQSAAVIRRAIPSSGEQIPVIGLGSANTFAQVARQQDFDSVRAILKAMVDHGGTVFDTAPGYGASEEVAGTVAKELGITSRIFWATKVNVAGGRGGRGGSADPAAARAQIDRSFARLQVQKIDLIQVHNMGDPPTQLGILKELKQQGRIRYIGITTTSNNQYGELEAVMRNEPLDFIGIDYAIDNREVETTILPLAQQRKIAVMVYLPFGRSRLFPRVAGKPVPEWAAEFDAKTWAQFFLKFVISHPAVTVATPGTSQAAHMVDNMGGGVGRLPDEAMRKRMAEHIATL